MKTRATLTALALAALPALASSPAGGAEAIIRPTGEGIAGMKVEAVATAPPEISVVTTGARYVFEVKANRVQCHQRIGAKRRVGTIRVDPAVLRLAELKVSSASDAECVLRAGAASIVIRNDSYIRFHGVEGERVKLSVSPAKARRRDLSTRRRGLYGFDREVHGWFDGAGGMIRHTDAPAFAVMPPRAFDWEAYFALRPAELGSTLWGLRGTKHVIAENAKRGVNLFIVWGGAVWQTDRYDATRPFRPTDEKALKRVVAEVHKLGAKVMLYLVNGELGRRGSPESYLRRIGELVKACRIDGVYHDAPTRGWTREQMLDFLRQQKRRFPKLLCFMHRPSDPLAEAYLDAKIIGEFDRKKGAFNEDAMDSRQWSNTVVFWVPDHNLGRTAEAVDIILARRARMYWGLLPATDLPGDPRHIRLWQHYYFPRLLEVQMARLHAAGRATDTDRAKIQSMVRAKIRFFRRLEQARPDRVPAGLPVREVTASSQEGVIYRPLDHPPAAAADGSTETCWLAAAERPHKFDWVSDHAMSIRSLAAGRMAEQWLQIDLGGEESVGRILYDTHWPGCGEGAVWQEAFRICASPDGKAWTPILERAGLKKARRFDVKVKPVRARYLRADGIRSRCRRLSFWHAAYVTELQAYPPR